MEKDETEGGDAFAYYFWAIAIFFFTLALLNFIVLLIIAHVLEISPSGMEAIEFMPGQGSVKFLKHLIGQIFQNDFWMFLFKPKNEQKYSCISALASKMGQIIKIMAHYHANY